MSFYCFGLLYFSVKRFCKCKQLFCSDFCIITAIEVLASQFI